MRCLPLIACLAAFSTGCGPATTPSDSDRAAIASAADTAPRADDTSAASVQSRPDAGGPSFAPWRGRLDELLTAELAAEVAGLPASDAEKDYIDGLPEIAYSWPSDRKEEYAGMQLAKKNRVSIAHIQTGVTPQMFRSQFRAASADELAQVDEAAQRQAGQPQQAANVRDLASQLNAVRPSEELPGLGDVAVLETGDGFQALHLLINGSSIRMTVDISDDRQTNRDATIELARRLLQRL